MATKSVALLGATSGLGQAVARQLLLARENEQTSLHLFLVARNESRLNEVADDLRARGAEITCIVCDLDATDKHSGLVDSLAGVENYWFFFMAACQNKHKISRVGRLRSVPCLPIFSARSHC